MSDSPEETLLLAIALGLILVGYAAMDSVVRRGGWEKLLGFLPHRGLRVPATLLVGLAAPFWSWPTTAGTFPLRVLSVSLAGLLAWNASTRDIDPVDPSPPFLDKALLLPAALLVWTSPAFLIVVVLLLGVHLKFWLHHATLPLRVLQLLASGLVVSVVLGVGKDVNPVLVGVEAQVESALFMLVVVVQISHYFITALAKSLIGKNWLSWVRDNRLHFLAASAYSWGWGRFVPWNEWLAFVRVLRRFEKPLQASVFILEWAAPLALLDVRIALVLCVAFAAFHIGVCAVSGLLFWDWILTDLFIFIGLWILPESVASQAFGIAPFLLGIVILFAFPLRHHLWKPMPLGWFDTPLTARIHWTVEGQSGRVYGLYNDFMCPHERLYGRVNGCFFVPHPVVTYHLGEVWKLEVRDGIVAAGPDSERLALVREQFGILPRSEALRQRHLNYLGAFFAALNRGARKSLLPRFASFLKAPGDQLFYWGDLPRYERQEPIVAVRLRFVEEYFDGEQLVRLSDTEVAHLVVPEFVASVDPELTPKELDDYLLGLARGRLIDLSGFEERYTGALSEL